MMMQETKNLELLDDILEPLNNVVQYGGGSPLKTKGKVKKGKQKKVLNAKKAKAKVKGDAKAKAKPDAKAEAAKKVEAAKKAQNAEVNSIVKKGAQSYENITKLMNIKTNIEGKKKSIDTKIEELMKTNQTPERTKQLANLKNQKTKLEEALETHNKQIAKASVKTNIITALKTGFEQKKFYLESSLKGIANKKQKLSNTAEKKKSRGTPKSSSGEPPKLLGFLFPSLKKSWPEMMTKLGQIDEDIATRRSEISTLRADKLDEEAERKEEELKKLEAEKEKAEGLIDKYGEELVKIQGEGIDGKLTEAKNKITKGTPVEAKKGQKILDGQKKSMEKMLSVIDAEMQKEGMREVEKNMLIKQRGLLQGKIEEIDVIRDDAVTKRITNEGFLNKGNLKNISSLPPDQFKIIKNKLGLKRSIREKITLKKSSQLKQNYNKARKNTPEYELGIRNNAARNVDIGKATAVEAKIKLVLESQKKIERLDEQIKTSTNRKGELNLKEREITQEKEKSESLQQKLLELQKRNNMTPDNKSIEAGRLASDDDKMMKLLSKDNDEGAKTIQNKIDALRKHQQKLDAQKKELEDKKGKLDVEKTQLEIDKTKLGAGNEYKKALTSVQKLLGPNNISVKKLEAIQKKQEELIEKGIEQKEAIIKKYLGKNYDSKKIKNVEQMKNVNSKLQEIFKLPDRLSEQRRQLNKLGNKNGRLANNIRRNINDIKNRMQAAEIKKNSIRKKISRRIFRLNSGSNTRERIEEMTEKGVSREVLNDPKKLRILLKNLNVPENVTKGLDGQKLRTVLSNRLGDFKQYPTKTDKKLKDSLKSLSEKAISQAKVNETQKNKFAVQREINSINSKIEQITKLPDDQKTEEQRAELEKLDAEKQKLVKKETELTNNLKEKESNLGKINVNKSGLELKFAGETGILNTDLFSKFKLDRKFKNVSFESKQYKIGTLKFPELVKLAELRGVNTSQLKLGSLPNRETAIKKLLSKIGNTKPKSGNNTPEGKLFAEQIEAAKSNSLNIEQFKKNKKMKMEIEAAKRLSRPAYKMGIGTRLTYHVLEKTLGKNVAYNPERLKTLIDKLNPEQGKKARKMNSYDDLARLAVNVIKSNVDFKNAAKKKRTYKTNNTTRARNALRKLTINFDNPTKLSSENIKFLSKGNSKTKAGILASMLYNLENKKIVEKILDTPPEKLKLSYLNKLANDNPKVKKIVNEIKKNYNLSFDNYKQLMIGELPGLNRNNYLNNISKIKKSIGEIKNLIGYKTVENLKFLANANTKLKKSFRKLDTPEKLELSDLDRLAKGNPKVQNLVKDIRAAMREAPLFAGFNSNFPIFIRSPISERYKVKTKINEIKNILRGETRKFNVNSVRNNVHIKKSKKLFGKTKSLNFVNKLFGGPPKLEELQKLSNSLGLVINGSKLGRPAYEKAIATHLKKNPNDRSKIEETINLLNKSRFESKLYNGQRKKILKLFKSLNTNGKIKFEGFYKRMDYNKLVQELKNPKLRAMFNEVYKNEQLKSEQKESYFDVLQTNLSKIEEKIEKNIQEKKGEYNQKVKKFKEGLPEGRPLNSNVRRAVEYEKTGRNQGFARLNELKNSEQKLQEFRTEMENMKLVKEGKIQNHRLLEFKNKYQKFLNENPELRYEDVFAKLETDLVGNNVKPDIIKNSIRNIQLNIAKQRLNITTQNNMHKQAIVNKVKYNQKTGTRNTPRTNNLVKKAQNYQIREILEEFGKEKKIKINKMGNIPYPVRNEILKKTGVKISNFKNSQLKEIFKTENPSKNIINGMRNSEDSKGSRNVLSQRFLSSKDGVKMYGDLIKIYQTQTNTGKDTQLKKNFPSTPDGISKLLAKIMSNPKQSQFSQLNKIINNAKSQAAELTKKNAKKVSKFFKYSNGNNIVQMKKKISKDIKATNYVKSNEQGKLNITKIKKDFAYKQLNSGQKKYFNAELKRIGELKNTTKQGEELKNFLANNYVSRLVRLGSKEPTLKNLGVKKIAEKLLTIGVTAGLYNARSLQKNKSNKTKVGRAATRSIISKEGIGGVNAVEIYRKRANLSTGAYIFGKRKFLGTKANVEEKMKVLNKTKKQEIRNKGKTYKPTILEKIAVLPFLGIPITKFQSIKKSRLKKAVNNAIKKQNKQMIKFRESLPSNYKGNGADVASTVDAEAAKAISDISPKGWSSEPDLIMKPVRSISSYDSNSGSLKNFRGPSIRRNSLNSSNSGNSLRFNSSNSGSLSRRSSSLNDLNSGTGKPVKKGFGGLRRLKGFITRKKPSNSIKFRKDVTKATLPNNTKTKINPLVEAERIEEGARAADRLTYEIERLEAEEKAEGTIPENLFSAKPTESEKKTQERINQEMAALRESLANAKKNVYKNINFRPFAGTNTISSRVGNPFKHAHNFVINN